jgi:hypothetical protein
MRWIIVIHSLVFLALLAIAASCLTYGKPNEISQLSNLDSVRMEGEFLQKLGGVAPGFVLPVKAMLGSRSAAFNAIEADQKFVRHLGELLLLLAVLQFVMIAVSIKVRRNGT